MKKKKKIEKDITANRHGGNAQSRAAHKDGNKMKSRATVYSLIKEAGKDGLTVDEISRKLRKAPNTISGRVTELKRDGFVKESTMRRKTRSGSTASVVVATKQKNHGNEK